MLRKHILIPPLLFLLTGCQGPKIGKDLFLEVDKSSARLENSKMEVVMELLAVSGASVERNTIKIGADLKITNQWHSGFYLKKLDYQLVSSDDILATGNIVFNPKNTDGILIESGKTTKVPLSIKINSKNISVSKHISRFLKGEDSYLQGTATVSAFGKDFEYTFKKKTSEIS